MGRLFTFGAVIPCLCFAFQLGAQQATLAIAPAPVFEAAHVTGDPYTGFRKSCVILLSDGRFHREHVVQDWIGGRGRPEWKPAGVYEGTLPTGEVKAILAEIDDPAFSSISGVIGQVRNPNVALWMGGPEIVPRESTDILVVSVAHAKIHQVFEVAAGARPGAPLAEFLERFKTVEKRSAKQLSALEANQCASLTDDPESPSKRRTASVGLQLPVMIRTSKPNSPSTIGGAGAAKLEFVVNPDGSVGEIQVNRAAGTDSERVAVETVKKWTFYPACLLDVPIAFRMQFDLALGDKPGVTPVPLKRLHSSVGRD